MDYGEIMDMESGITVEAPLRSALSLYLRGLHAVGMHTKRSQYSRIEKSVFYQEIPCISLKYDGKGPGVLKRF